MGEHAVTTQYRITVLCARKSYSVINQYRLSKVKKKKKTTLPRSALPFLKSLPVCLWGGGQISPQRHRFEPTNLSLPIIEMILKCFFPELICKRSCEFCEMYIYKMQLIPCIYNYTWGFFFFLPRFDVSDKCFCVGIYKNLIIC